MEASGWLQIDSSAHEDGGHRRLAGDGMLRLGADVAPNADGKHPQTTAEHSGRAPGSAG